MAAQLLRLKLQLLLNSFRRSPWEVVGLVVAIAYGACLTIATIVGFISLRSADPGFARDITILVGSLIALGFLLLPLVFSSGDPLDPRAFGTLGVPNKQLANSLLMPALISFPVVALALASLATIVTFGRGFWPVLLAVISAAAIVAAGALTLRIMSSVASILLTTGAAREISGVLGILALILVSPALILMASSNWGYDGLAALTSFADFLSWTPLGAAWAVAGDAANGSGGQAVLKLVIALVTIGALLLIWRALVARLQARMPRPKKAVRAPGPGWFEQLSIGPMGAIAARSMTYWVRDLRYRTSLAIIPIVPILMVVPLAFAGVSLHWLALVPLPVMCLFLGWLLHNDVAYDNTAIWLHLASGVTGRADRIGRIFPVLLVGIPLILFGSFVSIALFRDWSAWPSLVGFSASILLTGVGLSSFASARYPYPAVRPGDSPFAGPQSANATGGFVQGVLFLACLVISTPVVLFAVLGFSLDPNWHWAALIAGILIGAIMLTFGVVVGGRVFERRGPEILAAAMRN